MVVADVLTRLGIGHENAGACDGHAWLETTGDLLVSYDPSEGTPIAKVRMARGEHYQQVMDASCAAFARWRMFPAPKRGAIVREIGEELRQHKADLGALVSMERG